MLLINTQQRSIAAQCRIYASTVKRAETQLKHSRNAPTSLNSVIYTTAKQQSLVNGELQNENQSTLSLFCTLPFTELVFYDRIFGLPTSQRKCMSRTQKRKRLYMCALINWISSVMEKIHRANQMLACQSNRAKILYADKSFQILYCNASKNK